ncbi:MAG: DUF2130 domain-containing protein [Bacteroidota bacterium]|nr:DUF2130 domain-containing protein [Bacteroidota bacterium]
MRDQELNVMERSSTTISCPNCGTTIDVNRIVYHQLEEEMKRQLATRQEKMEEKYLRMVQEVKSRETEIQKKERQIEEKVASSVREKLQAEKQALETKLKRSLMEEQEEVLRTLREELQEKTEKVKELHLSRVEVERLKREKDTLREQIELEKEKELSERLKEERERLQKKVEDDQALRIKEKEKVIEDLKNQLNEARRRAEQGSMQLQGEIQELAIEEWLQSTFPLDTIEEIKKGARGGDCVQRVNTRTRVNCGTIYYESKRTKEFQPAWIAKFKTDMIAKGADLGVIVTEAMPKEMDRMDMVDGVWICSFEEFKGLSKVLRETIIRVNQAMGSQENKGEKMAMLYDYLTGNEFKMQLEAIIQGFEGMKLSLDRERRAMEKLWKEREKQIEAVLLNTTHFYGSIKGIAGNAIPTVPYLELPGSEEEQGELDL